MRRILPVFLFFALGTIAGSSESASVPAFSPDYSKLNRLVVQDNGIEKSFATYAEEQVRFITGSRVIDGRSGIEAFLLLVSDSRRFTDTSFFKVRHPVLRRFLGKKRISVNAVLMAEQNPNLFAFLKEPRAMREWRLISERASAYVNIVENLHVVPQVDFRGQRSSWIGSSDIAGKKGGASDLEKQVVDTVKRLIAAFRDKDPVLFDKAVEDLLAAQRAVPGYEHVSQRRIEWDIRNTRLRPFYWGAWFYLIAALLFAWATSHRAPRWIGGFGTVVLVVAFVFHVGGIAMRGCVLGRLPLANLYESLVFAVAGTTALSLLLRFRGSGVLLGLGSAALGSVLMGLANSLPVDMTRPSPLIAALQSYWLFIHVSVIMLAYSAFALSFFVSFFYVAKRSASSRQSEGVHSPGHLSDLDRIEILNHRIICVGFPLLTAGIVLGAIWAETAWGRPWGWDAKETWGAITWMVYAIYLHLRLLPGWSGIRSVTVSLIGFAAVVFTYLGVSFLLPGLHSYL